jgi:hypothetical protein
MTDMNQHFFHDYGEIYVDKYTQDYYCSSPDILIAYISWCLSQNTPKLIQVEYSSVFWAIHDCEHAKFDENSCLIYVTEDTEKIRLQDTFRIMYEKSFDISYDLCEEVSKAFNDRFNATYCFFEYCIDEGFIEQDLEEYD